MSVLILRISFSFEKLNENKKNLTCEIKIDNLRKFAKTSRTAEEALDRQSKAEKK